MNRRSFIRSALSLAASPVVGRLAPLLPAPAVAAYGLGDVILDSNGVEQVCVGQYADYISVSDLTFETGFDDAAMANFRSQIAGRINYSMLLLQKAKNHDI